MTLDDLGPRICVMGPSNSGKSTLANAIAKARGLSPIHLDQLRHLPNTNWQVRPWEDFVELHSRAIAGDSWVIDGNYTKCLPQRLSMATGFILLDSSMTLSLFRYFRRSWFEPERRGSLQGASNRVTWEMIRHITTVTRGNRSRYSRIFNEIKLPKLRLSTVRDLHRFYRSEKIVR